MSDAPTKTNTIIIEKDWEIQGMPESVGVQVSTDEDGLGDAKGANNE